LYGNGSGGFSNVIIGTGVAFTAGTLSATGSGGTVTSVAQSFTGGLISVAGSPITSSGTLALTVAGTSGGVPYFSSASTWATSAALTASALVVGGGAGAAPATTTTGTGVVTALGVNTGTAGAFVVNGGALGTPSSGTVTNLTGTASININGTVGATTPAAGTFTTEIINSNAAALPAPLAGTLLQIGNADGVATRLTLDSFATNVVIHGRRANGTAAAPTALASGNPIFNIGAQGYGATAYSSNRAVISFSATQAWTDTAQGTQIAFQTTPNGAAAAANALILGQDQSATVTGTITAGGTISPQQATTAGAPAYVKGAIYFDTTLNKLRVGGATAWETITSV
jgi:hypothetical protein